MLYRQSGPAAWLMAPSQATGVYFFPSREWPLRLLRYLKLLRINRLLEAGAGRDYLIGALAPLGNTSGIIFRVVNKGEGEFQSGLPVNQRVERGNVFQTIQEFRPEVVLCDWPPGQSFAGICQADFLRYIMVVGEAGGGATGVPQDWQTLRHRESPALSRYGRGRTETEKHRVTVFYGYSRRPSPGHSGWRCDWSEP